MPPAEQLRHNLPVPLTQALLVLLVVSAICSAGVGVENALQRSQDFQWSGAHLLAQHVDPWAEYLRGDPGHRLIPTQIPNYLAVLYILLFPLGLLPVHTASMIWICCNLFFAVASGILVARAESLRGTKILVVVCLLLMATATRNSIGNGQQGLLVLFFWCLALTRLDTSAAVADSRAALAGMSYLKFSFAPPLFLYLLFRSGRRAALCSFLPAFAGVVLVWWWLVPAHQAPALINLALEPFQVARTGFTPLSGDQDLMFLVQSMLHLDSSASSQIIEQAAALTVCLPLACLAFYVHRHRTAAWHRAIMAVMSYALFKHHAYDGVVLIFPLCYALKRWQLPGAKLVLALIAYLFYGQRVLEALHLHSHWSYIPEFLMLMLVLATVYRMREQPAPAAVPLEFPRPAFEEVALAG